MIMEPIPLVCRKCNEEFKTYQELYTHQQKCGICCRNCKYVLGKFADEPCRHCWLRSKWEKRD